MNLGLSGVTVRYGERIALDDVDLDAAPGAVTAVVGGDGSGKTTLLRVLVGLIQPNAGSVRRPPRARQGYFSAASGVYTDLTVAENLSFVATAYDSHDPHRRADLLDATGLAHVTGRLAGHLSGGMRQKLGLVMAMLHDPILLVLDEPSTGIDPVSRTELSRLIARAAAGGAAVVFSTAYLDEAERASTVLVLDGGKALRSGSPDQIVASVPGHVVSVAQSQRAAGRSWRRSTGWHEWLPPDIPVPPGTRLVQPDLEDAVIVAALQRGTR